MKRKSIILAIAFACILFVFGLLGCSGQNNAFPDSSYKNDTQSSADQHAFYNYKDTTLEYLKIHDNTEYAVIGINSTLTADIVIPEKYNGLPVTEIYPNVFNSSLEKNAETCKYIDSIKIPNTVKTIHESAFSCKNLKKVYMSSSLEEIKASAFQECVNLEEAHIENVKGWCGIKFGNNTSTPLFKAKLYCGGKKVTNLVIPDGVTEISDYAFFSGEYFNNNEITELSIPDSVTSIGRFAFSGFTALTNLSIPNGVKTIEDYAFYRCRNLTSITIPDGVTSIRYSAFSVCSSLTSITIPDSVTSIEGSAFNNCSSLTSITIPDNVISIGSRAFEFCNNLTKVTFNDPNGWYNGSDPVPAEKLSDPEQAANYLKNLAIRIHKD